jgi:hypothetical protein
MRRKSGISLLLGMAALVLWSQSELVGRSAAEAPAVKQDGIVWERTFEAAKARATRENKPILLLHLMGRLNEEFC